MIPRAVCIFVPMICYLTTELSRGYLIFGDYLHQGTTSVAYPTLFDLCTILHCIHYTQNYKLFAHTQNLTCYPKFHYKSHCKFWVNFSFSAVLPRVLQIHFCHGRTIQIITLLDTEVKSSKLWRFLVLPRSVNFSLQIEYKFFTLIADMVTQVTVFLYPINQKKEIGWKLELWWKFFLKSFAPSTICSANNGYSCKFGSNIPIGCFANAFIKKLMFVKKLLNIDMWEPGTSLIALWKELWFLKLIQFFLLLWFLFRKGTHA